MTIEFRCTSCNKLLRTSDDRAGARAKCPDCGTGITVPRPGGAPAAAGGGEFDLGYEEEPAPEADRFGTAFAPKSPSRYGQSGYAADTKNCPMCGGEIKAAAVKCRHCGEMLDGGGGYSGPRRYSDDEARSKVQAPAIAMLITFGLSFVILMFALLIMAIGGGRNRQMFLPGGGGGAGFFFVMYGVQGIVNVVILIGAWQMRGLKSHGLAMTASILAMIPFLSPCCLLGLPFGIWSVVTLNNPDVKNAFQ